MNEPLMWSPIDLGRWAGTRVRIHIALVIFVASNLFFAAVGPERRFLQTAAWQLLLLAALAVHELGHAAAAAWFGAEGDEVRLWPLGNMVGPSTPGRSNDSTVVAVGGIAASTALVLVCAVALGFLNARFVWSPFGSPDD